MKKYMMALLFLAGCAGGGVVDSERELRESCEVFITRIETLGENSKEVPKFCQCVLQNIGKETSFDKTGAIAATMRNAKKEADDNGNFASLSAADYYLVVNSMGICIKE